MIGGIVIEGNCSYCNKYGKILKYNNIYYCEKHFTQLKRHGKILEKTRLDKNNLIMHDDYFEIVLRNNKNEDVGHTLVSNDKFEIVTKYKWRLSKGYIITTNKNGKNIFLHRLILNLLDTPNILVDHTNHNPLDNRNENIRKCTYSQNNMNSRKEKGNKSNITGVVWDKARNKWRVQIRINGIMTNLGRYNDFKEAAKVRLEAERKYFGEFAPQKDVII